MISLHLLPLPVLLGQQAFNTPTELILLAIFCANPNLARNAISAASGNEPRFIGGTAIKFAPLRLRNISVPTFPLGIPSI
jgi:hypothetical protein